MFILNYLQLLSFLIIFFLANMVFFEDKANPINRVFAIRCWVESLTVLGNFMLSQVSTLAAAMFWLRTRSLFPLVAAITFHFALLFTKSKFSHSKAIYGFIYIPTVLLAFLGLDFKFSNIQLIQTPWGYDLLTNHTTISMFFPLWSIFLELWSWVLAFKFYLNTTEPKTKIQAKYVCLALIIPVCIRFISAFLPHLLRIQTPPHIEISTTVFVIIVVYSIRKYKLFAIDPAQAADRITSIMSDMFILVDQQKRIIKINQAVTKLLGYEPPDLDLKPLSVIVTQEQLLKSDLIKAINKKNIANLELRLKKKGKGFLWVSFSSSILYDEEGFFVGSVCIIRDIEATRRLTEEISYQAVHDSLTGLYNRRKFETELGGLLNDFETESPPNVVLYLDLDHFKIVNDTSGHLAGDRLLVQVANLIKKQIPRGDLLCRLGGDEFGVILEKCVAQKACEIAQKICTATSEYRFEWENRTFSVGFSIGIVEIDQKSYTINQVLGNADEACYIAKSKGGNQTYFYHSNDSELYRYHREMEWATYLPQAIAKNHFCLYYQPIVAVERTTSLPQCYEILLRMIDKQGRLIGPGEFLPAAQKYNFLPNIDRLVLKKFIEYYQASHFQKNTQTFFSINITGASINQESFQTFAQELIRKSHLPAGTICFEITESVAIANFNNAIQFIEGLKKVGCRFALDDFGSGVSSLNYLKHLPVDFLKIDGSFIKNIAQNEVDFRIVSAIDQVSHILGIQTVAEFVETEAIFKKLQQIGVDFVQGYWIAKPRPLIELPRTLPQFNLPKGSNLESS